MAQPTKPPLQSVATSYNLILRAHWSHLQRPSGVLGMEETVCCIVCRKCFKEIPNGEGHYDTPEGLVCLDCYDGPKEGEVPPPDESDATIGPKGTSH
jgi:hypothetical protein